MFRLVQTSLMTDHAVSALLADGVSSGTAVLAYMGPGAGIAAFGALLAMVGVFIFMVVGFVWYPLQQLRAAARRRRGKQAARHSGEGGEDDGGCAKLEDRYSAPDRFLHRVAFSTIPIQKALADFEDRLHAGRIANFEIERPVFIASLPRAGTTLLLETLCSSGAFVAHTYRHMPFLFIPLLWHAISHRFRLTGGAVERAHGDGLTIGYDSAEAFEEALWRAFHRHRYLSDRILPWRDDASAASAEFDTFIKNHMRKLIALHLSQEAAKEGKQGDEQERGGAPRYISKNNGNFARLAQIVRIFPDATVLVPLRNPVDHAASLLHAHLRFEEIHARESFTRRYMKDIGHFDFGANLRPIDFDHWLDRPVPEANNANFWLTYWRAAFAHILAHPSRNIVLVDYDGLCAQPATHLERIAGKTDLAQVADLAPAAGRFRAPTRYDAATLGLDESLLESAAQIHRELLPRCVD